jgi:hypothetical protein
MKRSRITIALSSFAMLLLAGVVWANVQLRVPQDATPPIYTSGSGPFILGDGSLFALNDGEWAAIVFFRSPDSAPAGFDFLNDFDPNVFDAPLHIDGFIELNNAGDLLMWNVHGTGAVPIWFVRWDELQDAAADGTLTKEELLALDSLRIGSASSFLEENHVNAVHPVSHLTVQASGTLEDGSTFDLRAVEVGLELKQVQITFQP